MKAFDTNPIKLFPAFVACKCPRCRVGSIFRHGPYALKAGKGLHDKCSHCNFIYEKEPGYFYGAMYVSFALAVGELITIATSISILTGSNEPWCYIIPMLSIVIALAPLNYRYSKVILMYFLTPGTRYVPEMSKNH